MMQNPGYKQRLVTSGLALLTIWLGIVLYAYLSSLSGLLTLDHYRFHPWNIIRGVTLYIWTPWLLLTPVVQAIALHLPVRPRHWASGVSNHFLLMTMLALVHGFTAAMLYYHIGDFSDGMEHYQPWQHTGHFLFMENMYLVDAVIYACLVGSQNINLGYLLAREKELESMRIQSQLNEAKLQALKMQVNPHFLFNTLNAIAVLVRKQDSEKAGEMLEGLSNFFRCTLERGEEQLITLEQEIGMIRQYLELEQIRFGERLQIRYQLDDNCLQRQLPALLLQPLVENAVKHGLASCSRCLLAIRARAVSEGMELQIENSGAQDTGPAMAPGTGTGLANVRARLQTLYAGLQRFEFITMPGRGTQVKILIPQQALRT